MPMLFTSVTSPFGRKIKVAMAVLGRGDVQLRATDTTQNDPEFFAANPLGKIPALKLDDGTVLFDSRVILEYLDAEAGGGRILPASGPARFTALRLQALSDGIIDAGILRLYEGRYRPQEKWHAPWTDRQAAKMARALDSLEQAVPAAVSGTPDVGQITLAVVLGWLDFRFEGAWREDHPKLLAWYEAFRAAVPAFAATDPA